MMRYGVLYLEYWECPVGDVGIVNRREEFNFSVLGYYIWDAIDF